MKTPSTVVPRTRLGGQQPPVTRPAPAPRAPIVVPKPAAVQPAPAPAPAPPPAPVIQPPPEIKADDTSNRYSIPMVYFPSAAILMGGCLLDKDMTTELDRRKRIGMQTSGDCAELSRASSSTSGIRVKVEPFQISAERISIGMFKRFIAGERRADLLTDNFVSINARPEEEAVLRVSWHDAQDFIAWLNKVDGNDGRWRLPSESEWEYVCRFAHPNFCSANQNKNNSKRFRSDFSPMYSQAPSWNEGGLGNADDAARNENGPYGQMPNEIYASGSGGRASLNRETWAWLSSSTLEWVEDCWNNDYLGVPSDGRPWVDGYCLSRIVRGDKSMPPPNPFHTEVYIRSKNKNKRKKGRQQAVSYAQQACVSPTVYEGPAIRSAIREPMFPFLRENEIGFRVVRVRGQMY